MTQQADGDGALESAKNKKKSTTGLTVAELSTAAPALQDAAKR
jgi:hypothetical protein